MDSVGAYINKNKVIKPTKNVWFQVDMCYPVGFSVDFSKYKVGDIIPAGSMLVYNYTNDKAEVISAKDIDKLSKVIGLTHSDIYIGKDIIEVTVSCVVKGAICLDVVDEIPTEVINNLRGITFIKTIAEKEIIRTTSFNDDFNNDMDIKVINN